MLSENFKNERTTLSCYTDDIVYDYENWILADRRARITTLQGGIPALSQNLRNSTAGYDNKETKPT